MEQKIIIGDLVANLAALTVDCMKDMNENGVEPDKLNAVRENIRFLQNFVD